MGNTMPIFQEKHSVKGIVSEDYLVLEKYTRDLFQEELKLRQARIDSSGH
jgi:hypothetical protein